jgi:ABC-type nitrate/sulfonate/bicarbonate transport system permease component
MAETGRLSLPAARTFGLRLHPVTALRIAIVVAVVVIWEAVSASGLLYRDVVPSLLAIGKALFAMLTVPDMPVHIDLGFLFID